MTSENNYVSVNSTFVVTNYRRLNFHNLIALFHQYTSSNEISRANQFHIFPHNVHYLTLKIIIKPRTVF